MAVAVWFFNHMHRRGTEAEEEDRAWITVHGSLPHLPGHIMQALGMRHNLLQVVAHSMPIQEALDVTVSSINDAMPGSMSPHQLAVAAHDMNSGIPLHVHTTLLDWRARQAEKEREEQKREARQGEKDASQQAEAREAKKEQKRRERAAKRAAQPPKKPKQAPKPGGLKRPRPEEEPLVAEAEEVGSEGSPILSREGSPEEEGTQETASVITLEEPTAPPTPTPLAQQPPASGQGAPATSSSHATSSSAAVAAPRPRASPGRGLPAPKPVPKAEAQRGQKRQTDLEAALGKRRY